MSDDVYKDTGSIAYGFLKSFLKERSDSVGNFLVKNKIGFLPQGMDYSIFQDIKRKTSFKQLKFLIGNHPTLPIVMTGLWINSLGEEEQVKVIDENRNNIYEKFGQEGVNILNMGTTGFMEAFIKFLTSYNIKRNPSQRELIDVYNSIIKEWSNITIFVKKDSVVEYLVHKCRTKLSQGILVLYIFASYRAMKKAEELVQRLSRESIRREEKYDISCERLNQEGSRKVWIFEKQVS